MLILQSNEQIPIVIAKFLINMNLNLIVLELTNKFSGFLKARETLCVHFSVLTQ